MGPSGCSSFLVDGKLEKQRLEEEKKTRGELRGMTLASGGRFQLPCLRHSSSGHSLLFLGCLNIVE